MYNTAYTQMTYIYYVTKKTVGPFTNVLSDVNTWSQKSGDIIVKCKHLHACRKTSCNSINVNINNYNIENVETQKILGIIFYKRCTFSTHCNFIKQYLVNRLNINKY